MQMEQGRQKQAGNWKLAVASSLLLTSDF